MGVHLVGLKPKQNNFCTFSKDYSLKAKVLQMGKTQEVNTSRSPKEMDWEWQLKKMSAVTQMDLLTTFILRSHIFGVNSISAH